MIDFASLVLHCVGSAITNRVVCCAHSKNKERYNGDVDNVPVIEIITIEPTSTIANATTADNGNNWTLNLADGQGNKAQFNLCNAFAAPYLAKSLYTINTSAETMATRGTVEPAQFDAETSSFTVADDSSLDYIAPGTYTIGDSGQYIDGYYSTFNGNKNSFKEATLVVDYDTATKTYDIEFDVTLTDDRNFKGAGTFTAE